MELAEALDYFFRAEPELDEKAARKFLDAQSVARLKELAQVVQGCEPFEAEALERRVGDWLQQQGLALKDVAQAARVALSGRKQSPGLFDVMQVLGRQRTVERLQAAKPGA